MYFRRLWGVDRPPPLDPSLTTVVAKMFLASLGLMGHENRFQTVEKGEKIQKSQFLGIACLREAHVKLQ